MTTWHEEQLLIDGKLTPAEGGATYENVNPATESVLGVAADATLDARRAIDAARRAFDTTTWSRDHEFRVRCMRQLHQALVDNFEPLSEILVLDCPQRPDEPPRGPCGVYLPGLSGNARGRG